MYIVHGFSCCFPTVCRFLVHLNAIAIRILIFPPPERQKTKKKNKKKGRVGKNKKKYATHKRNKKTSRPNEVWQQRLFTDGKRR